MSSIAPGVPRESRRDAVRYWLRDHKLAVAGWTVIFLLAAGGLGLYRAGAVDPLRIERPDTSFGTEGANLIEQGNFGPDMEVGAVGEGLDRTFIIRARGLTGPQPAVIFLHGFGSSLVIGYETWIEHLAREGLTVIFPSWQQPPFPTDGSQNPRVNMFRGVELATKAVKIQDDKVAVLGFSAGAALAFDYAALSKKLDVPQARLVYSIYPGRAFPGQTEAILPLPPSADMGPDTKVVTLISRKDEEAGTKWGLEQYDSLKRRGNDLRQLIYVTEPGYTDHFAPAKTDSRARRVFWQPFDRLLDDHLGVTRRPDVALKRSVKQKHYMQDEIQKESVIRRKAEEGASSVIDNGAGTSEATGAKPALPDGDPPAAEAGN